jgi:hypothetical protein
VQRVRGGKVDRPGGTCEISVAARINRDAVADVSIAAAQIGRVDNRRAGSIELGDEDIIEAAVGRLRRVDDVEVGGACLACEIGVAARINGDAESLVVPVPAQVGRIEQVKRNPG